MAVHYAVRERVAVVTIDNPPVNALGPDVWQEIADAIARAGADADADAVVLIGAGTTFIAGADIKVFDQLRTRDDSMARSGGTHAILRGIEDTNKPVTAAIHGHALGGGLEVAMACHFRVATSDAKVGQPEVLLGIIPGAGGTQRLPRLAGAALALEMCAEGRPVSASKARAAGILDYVVHGDLLEEAIVFAQARAAAREIRRTRDLPIRPDDAANAGALVEAARSSAAKNMRGARAPFAAIDAVAGALTLPFDAGAVREREIFAGCVVATESKALRHLFFAEREAAKVPGLTKAAPGREIGRAAIVGAGTMGGGIAMAYANAGIPVLLKDVDEAALARGLEAIRRNYEVTVSKGKMSAQQVERTMSLITPVTAYDGFDAVDVVVEAVFEDMALKRATFEELARVTSPACILASNSSTLDIDELGRVSGRPDRVLGHHFFSPANVMKLLEIVRGRETADDVIASSLALAKRLGKIGVVVGNCFGFVANRMLAYYMRESYLLLEEGADVAQIDRVMIEFGLPVGPYGMQDIAGIDVGARIRQYLASIGRTRAEGPQSAIPDRLFEMGRYGQKTGAGWYKYEKPGGRTRTPDPLIEELAEDEARRRGIARRPIADEDIVARITTALANEGARVLEDGYAARAGDIDVIYCSGFGFPRHRGGPMFYADTVGLPVVLARVEEYRARFGDYWEPAPLLRQLAAEGRSFTSGPGHP